MIRFKRIAAIFLAAGALAVTGCRSTHTTIVEPARHDHPDDRPDPHQGDRDHPPPPPPRDRR